MNTALTGCGIVICFESLFVLKFWFLITCPVSCCAESTAFPKQLEKPIEISGVLHLGMSCVPAGIKSPNSVIEGFSVRYWSYTGCAFYTERIDAMILRAILFNTLKAFYCDISDSEAEEMHRCKRNSAGKNLTLKLFQH